MTVLLGSGFPARDTFGQDEPEPAPYTVEDLRTEQILTALQELQAALAGMPAPQVHVDAPDLSSIVMAVQGLKPGSDADEIARAIVKELGGTPQQDTASVLGELVEAMKDLDFRMKGLAGGRGIGGGSAGAIGDIRSDPARQLGIVTVAGGAVSMDRSLAERMFARAPQANYSLWLDTADTTYIYIAEAPTAATGTDTSFQGIRVTKDASGNPLGKVEAASGFDWDGRAAATWA